MITAAFVLALAALGFGYRLLAGPTLTDRVLGVDGLLIVGMSAITLQAMRTGEVPSSPWRWWRRWSVSWARAWWPASSRGRASDGGGAGALLGALTLWRRSGWCASPR